MLQSNRGGAYVLDGTARWIVDDNRINATVGFIYSSIFVPDGFVKANGATVKRADYPRLVKLADKYNLWTSDLVNFKGLFGRGDGNTTMVLPNFMPGPIWLEDLAGGTQTAGLPNISGSIGIHGGQQNGTGGTFLASANGAFTAQSVQNNYANSPISSGATSIGQIAFDASKSSNIYGSSGTVRPPGTKALAIMKY